MINLVGEFNVQTVCDPLVGNGTTGLACAELGKSATLIEESREVFNIMKEKLELLGVEIYEN